MSTVRQFLKDRRKAELQGMHQFWFPGESMVTTRDELEANIAGVLTSGSKLREKLARLTRTQTALLEKLLLREGFTELCVTIRRELETSGIPDFEVENAARMLVERGFLGRRRGDDGVAGEIFEVPSELAEQLLEHFQVSGKAVAPEDQLSQKRLPFETDFESEDLDECIEGIEDERLRKLAQIAVLHRGLAEVGTPGVAAILAGDEDGDDPSLDTLNIKEWRDTLEERGIGTIGPVSLKDFGILVEEPALIVFQEWLQQRCRSRLGDVEEPDTVLEAGVDLYSDIDRLATRLELRPANLTRGGRVPKRVFESLRGDLYCPRVESHLEGNLVEAVMNLALTLGVIEPYGDEVRVHGERLAVWRKLDLVRQAEIVHARFLAEHQGDRWSFHQEALRQILMETLRHVGSPEAAGEADWVSLEALVGTVISTYMLELDERDVRGTLRQRREEDFARERLNSPFHRLGTDLVYWIVNRFLLSGCCELGYLDGRLVAFRLTALGKELLGVEQHDGENRLLVNPNFETILFCEGLEGMRLELLLSRFGQRISAERVRRYQISRDSMREGIRSGLSLSEIQATLEGASAHPLPEPVLVALKDWSKDLDWVLVEPAIMLRGLRTDRAQRLSELLAEEGCQHELCDDGSIVIPSGLDGGEGAAKWDSLLERLRSGGWLIRESALLREPERGESDRGGTLLEDLEPRRA